MLHEEELAGKIRAHEEGLRAQAQAHAQTQGLEWGSGSIGSCGTTSLKQPSLEQRIGARLDHARREGRKATRLEELSILLAKHPGVARILDLLEEVRS